MPTTKPHPKGAYLQGAVAMGGFAITLKQADAAMDRFHDKKRSGQILSFEQAREEVRAHHRSDRR